MYVAGTEVCVGVGAEVLLLGRVAVCWNRVVIV